MIRRGTLLLLTVAAAVALGAPAAATAGPPIPGPDLAGPDPTPSAHPHTYLVVTVNFKGGYSTPRSTPGRGTQELADTIRTTVNPWFADVSDGQYGDHTTARLGPITVQPKQALCTDAWRSEVPQLANAEVRKRLLEPSDYAAVFYYFAKVPQCSWDGAADFPPGNAVLLNGDSSQLTLVHELGHTLGLGHAGAMFCADADGTRVPVSPLIPFGSCNQRQYGNPYSAMGNLDDPGYSAAQLAQLGWNAGRVTTITDDTPPVTKVLTPLEDDVPGSTQAIHLIDEGFWLEYRKDIQDFPSGPPNGGLLVSKEEPSRSTPPQQHVAPFLLDMTPEDGDWGRRETDPWSPRMLVGQSWSNPNGNLKLTLNSQDASGASVTIESKVTYKTVPDLRDKTVANAEGAITEAGLAVAVETPKVDPHCARLGLVLTQSPARGTRIPAGYPVGFEYGVEPPHGCPIPE